MEQAVIALVVAEGPNAGDVIPVRQPRFLIGRGSGCHFRPSGEDIADLHCAILARAGRFYLRSYHPISVGGRQVLGVIELRDGDRLRVGKWHVRVCVRCRRPGSAEPAPPSPPSDEPVATIPTGNSPGPASTMPQATGSPGTLPVAGTPPSPLIGAGSAGLRPSKRAVILIGRKDRATTVLRQRAWEAAQAKPDPSPPHPRPRVIRRWLALTLGVTLLLVCAGVSYLAASATGFPASTPRSLRAAEDRPNPLPIGPRPPRRRAAAPGQQTQDVKLPD